MIQREIARTTRTYVASGGMQFLLGIIALAINLDHKRSATQPPRRNRFNVVNRALILGHKTRRASSSVVERRRTVAIIPRSLVSHFVSRERHLRSDFTSGKNVFVVTALYSVARGGGGGEGGRRIETRER